jgi:c-di-GMP-binding flagellar brake protein YcgR
VTVKSDERRKHKRVRGHLILLFRHVRDRVDRRGVVRDISQGGMRFVTEEHLTIGELLNLRVQSPLTSLEIRAVGRVRWVHESGRGAGERREVGVEFVTRSRHFSMEDRRQHHRLGVVFQVECRAGDSVIPGRLKDISQGGMRFVAAEALRPGQHVRLRLEAVGCSVVSAESGFPVEVTRSAQVVGVRGGTGRYEIRVRFLPDTQK